MTFYNILFGLLFFGAIKELSAVLANYSHLRLLMVAALALTIFNDTLYTSHSLEKASAKYTVGMKLIDLGNFLILAAATYVLSPKTNLFAAVSTEFDLDPKTQTILLWLFLSMYWPLALYWNKLAGQAMPEYFKGEGWITHSMFITPFLAFLLSFFRNDTLNLSTSLLALLALAVYVLIYKPLRPER